jgi:hypothetical protein
MAKKKGGDDKSWPPKAYYDNPYPKRQPRDKDDVLVTRNRRGQRAVMRPNAKPKPQSLPAKPRQGRMSA